MKVVYRADIEIDVPDTRAKHMAVFEASKQWPEVEEKIREVASNVTVTGIRTVGPGKADDDKEGTE